MHSTASLAVEEHMEIFFFRNNLFILNFTFKKKNFLETESSFFKMPYLVSGAEGAAGSSVPLGGGKSCPGGVWRESFLQEPGLLLCAAGGWSARSRLALPVQYLQSFLISD